MMKEHHVTGVMAHRGCLANDHDATGCHIGGCGGGVGRDPPVEVGAGSVDGWGVGGVRSAGVAMVAVRGNDDTRHNDVEWYNQKSVDY